jgi:hypothetical protein
VDDLQKLQVRAAAKLRKDHLEREQRHAASAWDFCLERVQLLDPLAPRGKQIAPFPPYPYLKILFHEIETHPRTIWWKPRRVLASWAACAYGVAKAVNLPYQRIFLISRRLGEDQSQGARELLWRSALMLRELKGGPKPEFEDGKLIITLPNGSTIAAVSSEPNALHGVAGTFVFGDEFSRWDDPTLSLAAILPTGERAGEIAGTFCGATTTAVGPFEPILYDGYQADAVPLGPDGIPEFAEDVVRYEEDGIPPGSLRAWTNPRNGFRIVDLHQEASPDKRDPAVLEKLRTDVGEDVYEQQYLKKFVSRGGRPIYGREFRRAIMVSEKLPVRKDEPLLVALDFGYQRPAAVVGQLAPGPQLRLYRACIGNQTTTRLFVHQLLARLKQWFPDYTGPIKWCCDHSGNRKRGEDETAKDLLLREFGIRATSIPTPPGHVKVQLDRVRDYMTVLLPGGECGLMVQHHPDTAFLIRGFEGGYKYKNPSVGDPDPEEPQPGNPWRDVMDCVRYLVVNFGGAKRVDPMQAAKLLALSRQRVRPPQRYVV